MRNKKYSYCGEWTIDCDHCSSRGYSVTDLLDRQRAIIATGRAFSVATLAYL
jgi:hypothetical protein